MQDFAAKSGLWKFMRKTASSGHKERFHSVQAGLAEFTQEEYLHPGWTCSTAAQTGCVRWPLGPSHTELDSELFLQVTQSPSSHRRSQDAKKNKIQHVKQTKQMNRRQCVKCKTFLRP